MTYFIDRQLIEKTDPWLMLALDELEGLTGSQFRIKPKTLLKFGRTVNADNGVRTTIAKFQADAAEETFATGNSIDTVSSDNTSDNGKSVTIEGHTVNGSGALTFVVQTATLGNQTDVALTTALYRATRIYRTPGTFASPATDLVGNVYVSDSTVATGYTTGTPDVATATKVMIEAGEQQSEKAATSLSNVDGYIITQIAINITRATASANARGDMEWRQQGGVWRPLGLESQLRTGGEQKELIDLRPYRVIQPNSDLRLIGISDTDNTTMSGFFNGVLALRSV